MKILYITTVVSTMSFFKSFIKELIEAGNTVDIASNQKNIKVADCYKEWGCNIFQIDTSRSPFNKGNINAIKEIEKIVSKGEYDIVHCHTPIAAACARIACRKFRKKGLKVIYTVHGYHFYKGAPLKNWLIFYPIELICSRWTDVLVTINTEDFDISKRKFKAKRIEYIPGVGIDVDKFKNTEIDVCAKRKELGIPEDAFLILSVGELNENKNQQIVLKAISEIGNSNIHYAIAGKGDWKDKLIALSQELHIENQFHLLGLRYDINEIYKCADVYTLPSIREGLNVSIMEALATGLPCIVSKIRGNVDLINENCGWLFESNNVNSVKECIIKSTNIDLNQMKNSAFEKSEYYNKTKINSSMHKIYELACLE